MKNYAAKSKRKYVELNICGETIKDTCDEWEGDQWEDVVFCGEEGFYLVNVSLVFVLLVEVVGVCLESLWWDRYEMGWEGLLGIGLIWWYLWLLFADFFLWCLWADFQGIELNLKWIFFLSWKSFEEDKIEQHDRWNENRLKEDKSPNTIPPFFRRKIIGHEIWWQYGAYLSTHCVGECDQTGNNDSL